MSRHSTYLAPGTATPCGHEWRTDTELFGLPLVHLVWGRDGQGKVLRACGIIAIGQFASGGLVVAQFGTGIITICQFSIGIVSISQFTIAGAALAQFSLSILTRAQFALCYDGLGQFILRLKDVL